MPPAPVRGRERRSRFRAARIRLREPCVRCELPNISLVDASRGKQPLKLIGRLSQSRPAAKPASFGTYCAAEGEKLSTGMVASSHDPPHRDRHRLLRRPAVEPAVLLHRGESGTMPPFQLTAITFGIGGLAGIALWTVRPSAAKPSGSPGRSGCSASAACSATTPPISSRCATPRSSRPACSTTSGRC